MKNIDAEPKYDIGKKFNEMLQTRLEKIEPLTWKHLHDALNHPTVALYHVAEKLQPFLPNVSSLSMESRDVTTVGVDEVEREMEMMNVTMEELQKEYIDISVCAAEEFNSNVSIKNLRFSILCLPPNIKREHRRFITKAKGQIKEADSAEDIMYVIGEHYDYLHYSLLKHIIDLYGSQSLKKRISEYAKKMKEFRKETRLEVFSQVCSDEPEETSEGFATMVTKHQINWKTATLDDVDNFRVQICRELSLYDFSLNLVKVARGCVEVTWAVPRCLVNYIKHCVKLNSESMVEHHVITLTINGFIVYDSSFAMQNEHQVIRLQFQVMLSHMSYLIEELSPEALIPHLVQRNLMSPSQAERVLEESIPSEKLLGILPVQLKNYDRHVGNMPTFCAVLIDAGLPHVAEKLINYLQKRLRGEMLYQRREEDGDIMRSLPPPPPPPNSDTITTQIEGSTLSRDRFNSVCMLTCSLLSIPIHEMVYNGHTNYPITIHWHTYHPSPYEIFSIFLYTEMASWGITNIRFNFGNQREIIIPDFKNIDLISASHDGDIQCVESSLTNGVPADSILPNGESSLMKASVSGHVEVVDVLLHRGATADQQNMDGWSSLMMASQEGHVEVVEKLLQHKATVDLQNVDGWTSLMLASLKGHLEVVERLLQHRATVDLQKKNGECALTLASLKGHVEVVKRLLQHGASVDLKNENDDTALLIASRNDHLETHAVLLRAGGNPNVCNKMGQTPLLLAIRKNNMAMVRELMTARVDLDHMMQDKLSALMLCCEAGNAEMAKLLLQSDANPNLQQSSTGYTALMFACKGGHMDTVKILKEHGADLQKRNAAGSTAFDVALANNFQDISEELMQGHSGDTSDQELHTENPETPRMTKEVNEVVRQVHEQIDEEPLDSDERVTGKKIPKGEYKLFLEIRDWGADLIKSSRVKLQTLILSDILHLSDN